MYAKNIPFDMQEMIYKEFLKLKHRNENADYVVNDHPLFTKPIKITKMISTDVHITYFS